MGTHDALTEGVPHANDAEERERESLLFMDSIPGMVALLSATGDVDILNRQLIVYFGQTKDELRNWASNGTIHPEDVAHVIDVFSRAIASGTPYEIVQRFRRADGVYRWFENRGFPLRDDAGRIVRWCLLLTDIDDRKHAEDALRWKSVSYACWWIPFPDLSGAGLPTATSIT